MTDYHKIRNNEREVVAQIKGRDFAHDVAEFCDEMRPEQGPHSVTPPQ